jgi:hypothetical protein
VLRIGSVSWLDPEGKVTAFACMAVVSVSVTPIRPVVVPASRVPTVVRPLPSPAVVAVVATAAA